MQITKLISKLFNSIRLFRKFSHIYRIKQARRIQNKLVEISRQDNGSARVIGYLRKINPFVFEELILNVIEDSNIHIIRNTRYTGDGGIDGAFKLRDIGKILIQCKRYKNQINKAHVEDLCQKVREHGCKYGIFVHTGKTGAGSKTIIETHRNVCFVSGETLVKLILGQITIEKHIIDKLHNKTERKEQLTNNRPSQSSTAYRKSSSYH
ncbi:restriction endonuclease [Paraburkholderia fungorum]|uniref:restriction endonuclease n=1 Tax=Paraburkholderia fungorum TaxID=134537 RepID=UPI000D05A6EB|nr:restriction endonuclease [Paraburkholderia fungorum]PRZ45339.1 restriction system protein [Paraburkholderia fungorum]